MHLDCENCGARIRAQDMNLATMVAACSACDAVFAFGKTLAATRSLVPRPTLSAPAKISVAQRGAMLEIQRRWIGMAVVPLIFFTLAWNTFMAFWYYTAIAQQELFMALAGTLHLIAGMAVAYATAAQTLNTSKIIVGEGQVKVRHGPIPWGKPEPLATTSVEQLYVRRASGDEDSKGNYELRVVLKDGSHMRLLEDLPTAEQALFLEQTIETHLGLPDRAVAGELSRNPGERDEVVQAFLEARGRNEEAPLELGPVEPGSDAACPICGEQIEDGPRRCSDCDSPHHTECWEYLGGCSTYGCSEAPSEAS